MKKHDEGYALPLVIVVMLILCLVAVSVMSFSLRNLQSQQASIEQMQEQYAAQGKLERLIGILKDTGDRTDGVARVITLDELCNRSGTTYSMVSCAGTSCTVAFTAAEDDTAVECVLQITSNANIETRPDANADTVIYTLTAPSYTYVSYAFTAVEPAEGGDPDAQ